MDKILLIYRYNKHWAVEVYNFKLCSGCTRELLDFGKKNKKTHFIPLKVILLSIIRIDKFEPNACFSKADQFLKRINDSGSTQTQFIK